MQPIQAHSIPYVWNPEKIDYSHLEGDTKLPIERIEHLTDAVNNYLGLNEIGLLKGKLELTDCGLPLSQQGPNYSLGVDEYNPILKNGIKKLPTLEDFSRNIKVKLPLQAQINQGSGKL
jgi:hypothetical protein